MILFIISIYREIQYSYPFIDKLSKEKNELNFKNYKKNILQLQIHLLFM